MERNVRKTFVGIVVSDTNDKTITVQVDTYKKPPLYSKRVMSSKKFGAHDEENIAHVGDKVEIMETRPLSATKRYRLIRVIEKHIGV